MSRDSRSLCCPSSWRSPRAGGRGPTPLGEALVVGVRGRLCIASAASCSAGPPASSGATAARRASRSSRSAAFPLVGSTRCARRRRPARVCRAAALPPLSSASCSCRRASSRKPAPIKGVDLVVRGLPGCPRCRRLVLVLTACRSSSSNRSGGSSAAFWPPPAASTAPAACWTRTTSSVGLSARLQSAGALLAPPEARRSTSGAFLERRLAPGDFVSYYGSAGDNQGDTGGSSRAISTSSRSGRSGVTSAPPSRRAGVAAAEAAGVAMPAPSPRRSGR